jgi:NAD-dependent SIR2 family protein deacetylase
MDLQTQTGFYVEPKTDCPHIAKRKHFSPNIEAIASNGPCEVCAHEVENWACLACSKRFCSRYVKGHMQAHREETGHALAVSYSDFSFWCYACDSYVASPAFHNIIRQLHIAKFGPLDDSNTAHTDPEQVEEHEDNPSELEKKIRRLAEMVRAARHMIVFTGAGISTSAGIADYRGPQGQWTLQAKGLPRTMKTVSLLRAVPTPSHMALVSLHQAGILKHLISQNTDGLHRRSGMPPEALSELHGNANRETCNKCGRDYLRDFSCHKGINIRRDHQTGRKCVSPGCDGDLRDTIINFGESLPQATLEKAFEESDKADLCLVLGSSLTVTPAADCPKKVGKRRNGKLVIVNLQKTPLDRLASLRIFGRCDVVMDGLIRELGLSVPQFMLHRGLLVAHRHNGNTLTVEAMDADGTPMTLFRKVKVTFPGSASPLKQKASEEDSSTSFLFDSDGSEQGQGREAKIELQFFKHYDEPVLNISYPLVGREGAKRYTLDYCPAQQTESEPQWNVHEVSIDYGQGGTTTTPISHASTSSSSSSSVSGAGMSDEEVRRVYAPTVKDGRHPQHQLVLTKSSYAAGAYRCDACLKLGSGWVYHCEPCGYDLHPHCANK